MLYLWILLKITKFLTLTWTNLTQTLIRNPKLRSSIIFPGKCYDWSITAACITLYFAKSFLKSPTTQFLVQFLAVDCRKMVSKTVKCLVGSFFLSRHSFRLTVLWVLERVTPKEDTRWCSTQLHKNPRSTWTFRYVSNHVELFFSKYEAIIFLGNHGHL